MIRAALYARVSTEMQEKEQTIQSQLAAISRYAEEQGVLTTPALTYRDDGYSGSQLDRPALDELRDHAREGRFEKVVVLCPDRLARKYAYQVLLMEELNRAGVEVHFCEHPISDSPDDQLLLQIQGAVAEYERAKILERARRGRLHRAQMGEWVAGQVPYGYRYAPRKHGGDGRVSVDEDEAALVRQVFQWYAQEGETLYGLVKKLNASGWSTRAGRQEWSSATLLGMLKREWYIGKAYYNRHKAVRNERPLPKLPSQRAPMRTNIERPKSEWVLVPVPPIIDEDLFARVQQRIQENRRFARRRLSQEGVYLLRGLIKCGLCGHAFVANGRIRKSRDGTEHRYHIYTCNMRKDRLLGALPSPCTNEHLPAAGVDEAVWTAVRDLLLDSEALARELDAWADRTHMPTPEGDRRIEQMQSRLQDLTRQQERLTDAYQAGVLPLDVFRSRMHGLEESLSAASVALSELRSQHLDVELTQLRARGAEDVIQQLRPLLLNADFNTRQTVLRLLVEQVVATGQRLEIHLAVPVSGNFDLTSEHQKAA